MPEMKGINTRHLRIARDKSICPKRQIEREREILKLTARRKERRDISFVVARRNIIKRDFLLVKPLRAGRPLAIASSLADESSNYRIARNENRAGVCRGGCS